MTIESKTTRGVQVKDAKQGLVEAVFSTFDVIDSDGDVTRPDAFNEGEEVVISAYGHKSWDGLLPVGEGRIKTTRSQAILDGQFWLDTDAGAETFKVVDKLAGKGKWSYGFDVLEKSFGEFDGQDVRFLNRLKVYEVSPVLLGAGVDTRTLVTKGRKGGPVTPEDVAAAIADRRTKGVAEYRAAIRPHETPTTMKAWDGDASDASLGPRPGITELRAVHAWCDPDGDPEAKASYRLAHHDDEGAANLRACLVGIGVLNAGKSSIPTEDVRGVYNHLAAHLEDGGIEPPELRSGSGSKQNDRIAVVLADLATVRHSIEQTNAQRVAKGRGLGAGTVLLAEWLTDELKALRAVLDSPHEQAEREMVRFIAQQRRLEV